MEGKSVTLYGHDCCPGTVRARDYLRRHGIPFVERDVTQPGPFAEMVRYGTYATPLLVFGESRMVGFDAKEFERLWDQA